MRHTIRPYRPDDIPGIARVINAADRVYNLEDGTSEQELVEQFSIPGLDPEKNVFVAQQNGRITAFGLVRFLPGQTEDAFRTWFSVDPEVSGQGLDEEILEFLYGRAEEHLPDCKTSNISFYTTALDPEKERIVAVEHFGMVDMRRSWVMTYPSLDSIPEPEFPTGIIGRPYRMGADDIKAHQADNEAFRDHWGHVDHPFEMWQHYIARPSFRPELSVLAEDTTGDIAGLCTIVINDEENARLGLRRGWIDDLAVRRPWRRHGLGTALLLAGLHNLRRAQVNQAALGCDAENQTGAVRIYRRVGFKVHRERVIYRKEVTPIHQLTQST